jgi:multicomponent Na+:H+ antiporter subunit G
VTVLVIPLACLGIALMVVAGIGLLRMPDLLTRMHASSKAGTLGAALVLVAVAVQFSDAAVTVRALLVCVFLLLTAPIASHVIARAAYRAGVPLSPDTFTDEPAAEMFRAAESGSGESDGGVPPVAGDSSWSRPEP